MIEAAHLYRYTDANPTWANGYLWPVLREEVNALALNPKRAFDLGCGNGATGNMLASLGFDVTMVAIAKKI
jgi:hypothetical protein